VIDVSDLLAEKSCSAYGAVSRRSKRRLLTRSEVNNARFAIGAAAKFELKVPAVYSQERVAQRFGWTRCNLSFHPKLLHRVCLRLEPNMNQESRTSSTDGTDSNEDVHVSVVIPVYNCETYLRETVESVRNQDIGSGLYEIIAVDDGSTDKSLDVLEELAGEGTDLQIYTIPNSGSAAAPRNLGLEKSHGRYVFFLDADDKLEPDALRKLVSTADETNSGVVLCKLGAFGPAKRAGALPARAFVQTQLAVDFVESDAVTTLGALKLFRRSILIENEIRFPLGFVIGEDQPFTMKAYLHSPHISILADKVYYWARGRGDGTNVTSTGQPPRKHLERIKALIDVIVENTEPGELRDILLKRPIAGPVGVPYVFGKKFVSSHSQSEREEMLADFRPVVTELWTPRLRSYGVPIAQVLTDLIVRNDLDEIEALSTRLGNKKPLPLKFDYGASQFVYQPIKGDVVPDLRVSATAKLESLTVEPDRVIITGEVGVDGASEPPDSARLVWRHRKLKTEVAHDLDITRTYSRKSGTKTVFTTTFTLDEFKDTALWDATVEADWGELTLVQHLGKLKSANIVEEPIYFDSPTPAALFYTRFGNLGLDVGRVEKHLEVGSHRVPKPVGSFSVGRREIVELRGRLGNFIRADVRLKKNARTVQAELVKHTDSSASVVLPRSIAKKGGYAIDLIDAEDNRIEVPAAI
jgi:hypothetical protein